MQKTEFYGHSVFYDENDRYGYEYLSRKIDREETKVLFDYAKSHGQAQFETQTGKNYSLVHNNGGTYKIVKR